MKSLKDAFPFLRNHPRLVYLDSAATAHKPDCVVEAISHFYTHAYATVHRGAYRHSIEATELYAAAREATQVFLSANSSEEIIFTRGTTDSINLVARSFPFEEGDEILVSKMEHHSNLLPWQMIAKEKHLLLKWIDLNEEGSLKLPQEISSRTKLIACAHVSNVTGIANPISEIVRLAKTVGAAVLVDGAQAAVHQSVDVKDLGIDFYAFSPHKCYGPTGIGVLYGKKNRLAQMTPSVQGGGMVQHVDFLTSSFEQPPFCFEAGSPMSAEAIGWMATIDFLKKLDRTAIAKKEEYLFAIAAEELQKIEGLRILGKSPILSFTVDGVHPLDLATFLDAKEISVRSGHLCAQPLLNHFGLKYLVRASFALYNEEEDAHRLAKAVEQGVSILKTPSNLRIGL